MDPNDEANRELLQHLHDIRHELVTPSRLFRFRNSRKFDSSSTVKIAK